MTKKIKIDAYNRPVDPMLVQMVDAINFRLHQGWTLPDIATTTSVSPQALKNWLEFRCTFGHTRTLNRVSKAIGYRFKLVRDNA
jgi:hypothetical protein